MSEDTSHTTTTSIQDIDDDNFLDATAGRYTFVDFWAPWCAPCRSFAPTFEHVAEIYADRFRFARCNVDEATSTAELVQVQTIPTVVGFDPDGNEVGRVVNPPAGAFEQMVEEVAREL